MKPEFEQALKDMAVELARPKKREAKIDSILDVLMPDRPKIIKEPTQNVQNLRKLVARRVMNISPTPVIDIVSTDPIYTQLRGHRLEKGFTQRELAQKAGIDHSTLSKIESGREGMSTGVLGKLVLALGLNPEQAYSILASGSCLPVEKNKSKRQTEHSSANNVA